MDLPLDLRLEGRPALVLGLGRFSGGVETVKFLTAEGARVTVSDAGDPAALADSIAAVAPTGAQVRFGPQTTALLDAAGPDALVVASPAVPQDHPVLVEARRRGLPVTSETALFLARCRGTVVAVTGTKGKSTTATLLASMVSASGVRTHLGGNVGRSLLNVAARIAPSDVVVVELSSFQLEALAGQGFAPRVAVVTNLFPDHLDRHGTFAAYAAAKRTILEAQRETDVAVLPVLDEALEAAGFFAAGSARRLRFGEGAGAGGVGVTAAGGLAGFGGGTALEGFPLWGRHNRVNAAAAAAAAIALGATWAEVAAGARATRPLPHRLEPVHEAGGVLFVDDSIATTPQSTTAALEAVPRPCVVLVGGRDKGADPAALVAALAKGARAVVGIGTTGPALVAALKGRGGVLAVDGGADLDAAVSAAVALARPGDAVLLSPGYSSLDQHPSFAVRGERFAAAARRARPARPDPAGGSRPAGSASAPAVGGR